MKEGHISSQHLENESFVPHHLTHFLMEYLTEGTKQKMKTQAGADANLDNQYLIKYDFDLLDTINKELGAKGVTGPTMKRVQTEWLRRRNVSKQNP